jgi:hypothetical protein
MSVLTCLQVPEDETVSHGAKRSLCKETYGLSGVAPADGPRDAAALDGVRMNSGAFVSRVFVG